MTPAIKRPMITQDLSLPTSLARLSRLCIGLPFLQGVLAEAEELKCESWEFAVPVQELYSIGLTGTDLRWLVSHGLLEHAYEQVRRGKHRRFLSHLPLRSITEQSCFILSEEGQKFTERLVAQALFGTLQSSMKKPDLVLPCWDADLRVLRWKGKLVKRFRSPAHCQEIILNAFEQAKWVTRIDNPLPKKSEVEPHQQLHDTIRRLNKNQLELQILFTRDGTGKGLCWQGV
jgi:hypothetical protein